MRPSNRFALLPYALLCLQMLGCARSETRVPAAQMPAGALAGTTGGMGAAQAAGASGGTSTSQAAAGKAAQAGAAASSAAPGSREDCSARESQATTALQPLLEAAAAGCQRDADCELISIDTLCHAACGATIAHQHRAEIDAEITRLNAGMCAQFVAAGCKAIIPPCVPPGANRCEAGRCTSGG